MRRTLNQYDLAHLTESKHSNDAVSAPEAGLHGFSHTDHDFGDKFRDQLHELVVAKRLLFVIDSDRDIFQDHLGRVAFRRHAALSFVSRPGDDPMAKLY